tara:strand:+ start:28 stop:201 length:174 start_codon:yes stop_codon:yes gene_type:complete
MRFDMSVTKKELVDECAELRVKNAELREELELVRKGWLEDWVELKKSTETISFYKGE